MRALGAFFTGVAFGGAVGWALGLLSAPKPGSELRDELAEASDTIYRKAAYEIEELADRLEHLRHRIEQKQAAQQAVQDFTPRVEKVVEKAQTALQETRQTTAESRDVLQRTQTN